MDAKTTLRWFVITAFGGYGVYAVIESLMYIRTQPDHDWAAFLLFGLPTLLFFSGLFLGVAYFVGRRQYRSLCTLILVVGTLTVYATLNWLTLSVLRRLVDLVRNSPSMSLVALPVALTLTLAPIFVAAWAYRRGQALVSRFIPEDAHPDTAG